jgi:UDP-N-acetylmuramoyl-tripeptide--D-alanyl-D-alanine ligase
MFKLDEVIKATSARVIKPGLVRIIKGISTDTRTIKPGFAFVAIRGENFDGSDFISEAIKKGASCVIWEHGSKKPACFSGEKNCATLEVRNSVKALGDLACFWRRKFNVPIIAVTGSNGKTTTKEMIASVLSANFVVLKNEGTKNNHIGLPMSLLKLNHKHDIAVLEIGTNHFGEVENLARICLPNLGVITNIGPSHLESFGNLKGVFKEKSALLKNMIKPQISILNADDPSLNQEIIKQSRDRGSFSFGIKQKADFSASHIKVKDNKTFFSVNEKFKFTLGTCGYYNIYNALAAIAVGRIFSIEYPDLILSLSDFDFPSGRLKLKKSGGLTFIDDTYNANPLSLHNALAALKGLKTAGRKIFAMGDMLELGKNEGSIHERAGMNLKDYCDVFVAVGRLAQLAARSAEENGFKKENIFICADSRLAKEILKSTVKAGPKDLILVKGSRMMKMEGIF